MPDNMHDPLAWLEARSRDLVSGARRIPESGELAGLALYYPTTGMAYRSFYLRDFVYMYESAPELFAQGEVRPVLEMLLGKLRADGWAPERVNLEDGKAIYRCHGNGDVVDSGLFFVKLFNSYAKATGDVELIRANLDKFWRMLDVLPHDETGLIWVDPANPHTSYGFTDTVALTGQVLFCSLMTAEALDTVSRWSEAYGRNDLAERCQIWRAQISSSLGLLWSKDSGMFFAASQDCRQIDVWGSIYACHMDIANPEQRAGVLRWLAENRSLFEYRGHLRHLPEPDFWQRMTPPYDKHGKPGEFQNGTYWSTPTGWYGELLETTTPGAGERVIEDTVRTFIDFGVWECLLPSGYRRIQDNLSSVLLPYASLKRIRAVRRHQASPLQPGRV